MPSLRDEVRMLSQDIRALPSSDSAIWAGIGTAATIGVHPFDDAATVRLETAQEGTLHNVFIPGKFIGETTVQVGLAAATYVVGRVTKRPKVATAGFELIRAQLITEGLVQGLKVAVRRERPDASDNRSFPSGHAALTFATATVLQRRFGWARSIPAYIVASYVAAARVTEDKHYVSDVIGGAFVGIIAARTVTREGRRFAELAPVFGRQKTGVIVVLTF
jgi:membrane-associated phospholipid phosphatase